MNWQATPTGKRGRQPDHSDAAIQTCLTMMVLFGIALRQTTSVVESPLHLIGLDWAVPDFSTLSRRQRALKVNIPYRGSVGPLHILIGSTGIKIEGEGEWNARKNAKPCKPEHPRGGRLHRSPTRVETLRPNHLATLDPLSPPKPRQDKNALAGSLEPVAFTGLI